MLTSEGLKPELTTVLTNCRSRRQWIRDQIELLKKCDAILDREERALTELIETTTELGAISAEFRQRQLPLPGTDLPNMGRRSKKRYKRPDVQVIEEILHQYGPLHVSKIVQLGQSRGVSFAGNKKPAIMARDKMANCKRFHLFGNNVWGLPNQELPEHPTSPSINGHIPATDLADMPRLPLVVDPAWRPLPAGSPAVNDTQLCIT